MAVGDAESMLECGEDRADNAAGRRSRSQRRGGQCRYRHPDENTNTSGPTSNHVFVDKIQGASDGGGLCGAAVVDTASLSSMSHAHSADEPDPEGIEHETEPEIAPEELAPRHAGGAPAAGADPRADGPSPPGASPAAAASTPWTARATVAAAQARRPGACSRGPTPPSPELSARSCVALGPPAADARGARRRRRSLGALVGGGLEGPPTRAGAPTAVALRRLAEGSTTPRRRRSLVQQVHEHIVALRQEMGDLHREQARLQRQQQQQQQLLPGQQQGQQGQQSAAEELASGGPWVRAGTGRGPKAYTAVGADSSALLPSTSLLLHAGIAGSGSTPAAASASATPRLQLGPPEQRGVSGAVVGASRAQTPRLVDESILSARDSLRLDDMMDNVEQRMNDLMGVALRASASPRTGNSCCFSFSPRKMRPDYSPGSAGRGDNSGIGNAEAGADDAPLPTQRSLLGDLSRATAVVERAARLEQEQTTRDQRISEHDREFTALHRRLRKMEGALLEERHRCEHLEQIVKDALWIGDAAGAVARSNLGDTSSMQPTEIGSHRPSSVMVPPWQPMVALPPSVTRSPSLVPARAVVQPTVFSFRPMSGLPVARRARSMSPGPRTVQGAPPGIRVDTAPFLHARPRRTTSASANSAFTPACVHADASATRRQRPSGVVLAAGALRRARSSPPVLFRRSIALPISATAVGTSVHLAPPPPCGSAAAAAAAVAAAVACQHPASLQVRHIAGISTTGAQLPQCPPPQAMPPHLRMDLPALFGSAVLPPGSLADAPKLPSVPGSALVPIGAMPATSAATIMVSSPRPLPVQMLQVVRRPSGWVAAPVARPAPPQIREPQEGSGAARGPRGSVHAARVMQSMVRQALPAHSAIRGEWVPRRIAWCT